VDRERRERRRVVVGSILGVLVKMWV
jgi:hypothetical protein